jgi:CubicO group peptidase (beta-lactamase class C family)
MTELRMFKLFSFALLLLTAASAFADDRDDIDRLVRATLAEVHDTPGLSVAVVKDGKVVLAEGYGLANIASKRPMTATTPVYIGSSTKSYTGLLLATLAQRGVLDLDTPILKYLPELKDWPDAARITLRQLLTHSAGISNSGITMRTAYTGEYTSQQLVQLLRYSRSIDRQFTYDNLGYVVASLIAERVTGKKWQDLMEEIVLQPLGMRSTSAYFSRAKGAVATGYVTALDRTQSEAFMAKRDETMHAAGGIVTTAKDLSRWLVANIEEPAPAFRDAHKLQITLVKPSDRFKVHRTGYGFGWYVSTYDGIAMLEHSGGYPGWRAHVSFLPKKRIGVAIVSNNSGLGGFLPDVLAAQIYDRLLGKPASMTAQDIHKRLDGVWQQMTAEREMRSKRPPTLLKPIEVYAGTYENPSLGELLIERSGDRLVARYGPLHSVIEQFTEPDSGRVEMVPDDGEVLRFKFGEPKNAISVSWGSDVFTRNAARPPAP